MLRFAQNIMQLILAPARGWEDLAYDSTPVSELVNKRVFPLFGLAAITKFVQMAYDPSMGWDRAIICAAVIFVSLFAVYYFGLTMFHTVSDKMFDGDYSNNRSTRVVGYTLSLIAISVTIINLIPVSLGLQYILPLGVALVLWKSSTYMRVPQAKDFQYACFGAATLIVPVFLLIYIFDLLL